MTYGEATEAARNGQQVIRPHWHWVYMSCGPNGGLVLFEDDGERRCPFVPTADDKRATDWQQYLEPRAIP